MRSLLVFCVVSLAVAVACGGGKTDGGSAGNTPAAATSASTDAASPTGADDGRLADALLAISDLPTGWSQMPDNNSSSSNSKLCNNVDLDQTKMTNATAKASRSFTKGGTVGPFFIEDIVTLPGSDAGKALTGLRDAMSSCKQWTEPSKSGNSTNTYSLGEVSFPKFGDESIAFRLTTDATILGSGEGDFVFIRHGHSLLFAVYAGVNFTGLDTDQWVALMRSADDKVRSHGVR